MIHDFRQYTSMISDALDTVSTSTLDLVATKILHIANAGGRLFVCGNGGSAAIAEHFSCDHTKGICSDTNIRPQVVPLGSNVSLLTAIGNDIGYDQVFSKQIEWFATSGDGVLAISSSGNSPNIINALTIAAERNIPSIAFVGFDGGRAKSLANICVHVNAQNYGVIEDCHQIIMHSLAQSIRTNHAITPSHIRL